MSDGITIGSGHRITERTRLWFSEASQEEATGSEVGIGMDVLVGDCKEMPLDDNSVDLVFCSPPYEDARTYGIDFKASGQAWVDWAMPRFVECLRVCRGLVAWVVEGRTRGFSYSATPMRLACALQDAGYTLRKPPIYKRVGIPGSGGPDWLRNDYEFIVCATREGGRLPWSDNKACGHECKYPPGGPPSHRTQATSGYPGGDARVTGSYKPPTVANPGNVIECVVGGGHMGHALAHENEAPFPLSLAEFFVQSFCPPGGVVLDPFCGSGTTLHAAALHGRDAIGMDIRESQVDLAGRRMESVQ